MHWRRLLLLIPLLAFAFAGFEIVHADASEHGEASAIVVDADWDEDEPNAEPPLAGSVVQIVEDVGVRDTAHPPESVHPTRLMRPPNPIA